MGALLSSLAVLASQLFSNVGENDVRLSAWWSNPGPSAWATSLGKLDLHESVITAGSGLAAVADRSSIQAVSIRNGRLAWRKPVGRIEAKSLDLAVCGRSVVLLQEVSTEGGSRMALLTGYGARDGRLLFSRLYDGRPCTRLIASGSKLLFSTRFAPPRLYVLDALTGGLDGVYEDRPQSEPFKRLLPELADRLLSFGEEVYFNGRRLPVQTPLGAPPNAVFVWRDRIVAHYDFEDFPLDLGVHSGLSGLQLLRPESGGWDTAAKLVDERGNRLMGSNAHYKDGLLFPRQPPYGSVIGFTARSLVTTDCRTGRFAMVPYGGSLRNVGASQPGQSLRSFVLGTTSPKGGRGTPRPSFQKRAACPQGLISLRWKNDGIPAEAILSLTKERVGVKGAASLRSAQTSAAASVGLPRPEVGASPSEAEADTSRDRRLLGRTSAHRTG